MTYLKYSDFSLPKRNSDANQWADHIEFFCFLSQESEVSEQQIIDRLLDENSNEPLMTIENLIEETEITDLVYSLDLDNEMNEDEIVDDSSNNPALNDKITFKIKSYFNICKSRQETFRDDYPFIIKNNYIKLKPSLSPTQTLYTILLCSSLLRLATKKGLNKLGHHFEELCGPAFAKLTPRNTKNLFFGSGAGGDLHSPIKGTFYQKVLNLCNQLHVSPKTNFTEENAGKNNVGDGGLDWVGIYNFPDNQFSQPTFFGQCACGSDWIEKQFDAHHSKWKNYVQFENGYLTYHFIPRHFRDEVLSWSNPLDILDVVLIDRYRLIELLKEEPNLQQIIDKTYSSFLAEVNDNRIDSFT